MASGRSYLPPYSTFQTDNKSVQFPHATSQGNVLSFTPPGFQQELNVKFPDSRLAVCEACKRNFKTRDMCRVRNQHTDPPWTVAYICLSLDDSCIDEETGKYVDKPMICRMVQWQPFVAKQPFHKKTPVCASCKKTNRTRQYCREKHKHPMLPWNTVYVLLSTLESADPSTVVAAPSKPIGATVSNDTEDTKLSPADSLHDGVIHDVNGEQDLGTQQQRESPPLEANRDELSVAESRASDLSENASPAAENAKRLAELGESEDINDIGGSRTMLIRVSSAGTTIIWLEPQVLTSPLRRDLSPSFRDQPVYHSQLQHPEIQPQSPYTTRDIQPREVHSNPSSPPPSAAEQQSQSWPSFSYGTTPYSTPNHPPLHAQMQESPRHPPVVYSTTAWPGHPQPPLHAQGYVYPARPPSHPPHSNHHVPVIRSSPGPGTPVPAPSPAPRTAGEAAAAQCLRHDDTSDSQSPHPPHLHHLNASPHVPIQPAPVRAPAPIYAAHGMQSPPPQHPQYVHQHLPPHHADQQCQWAMYQPVYHAQQLPPPQMLYYPPAGVAAEAPFPRGMVLAETGGGYPRGSPSPVGDGEQDSPYHASPGKRLHDPSQEESPGDEDSESSKRRRFD